jgi:hypothetical protein
MSHSRYAAFERFDSGGFASALNRRQILRSLALAGASALLPASAVRGQSGKTPSASSRA